MNNPEPSLQRLFHWARQAPRHDAEPIPYGFATRVVGQWQTAQQDVLAAIWERFAFRAAFAAGVILILGAASYFTSSATEVAYDYTPAYSAMEIASVP